MRLQIAESNCRRGYELAESVCGVARLADEGAAFRLFERAVLGLTRSESLVSTNFRWIWLANFPSMA
jgi:hypothetical protein